jgi:hypothetical protein
MVTVGVPGRYVKYCSEGCFGATNPIPIAEVFINPQASVEVKLRENKYHVRVASGRWWYGPKYLFGPCGKYRKHPQANSLEVTSTVRNMWSFPAVRGKGTPWDNTEYHKF